MDRPRDGSWREGRAGGWLERAQAKGELLLGPGHRRTQLRQADRGGGAHLQGNKGKSISLTNCVVGGWAGGVETKRVTPPRTPSERNCLSIKTDAGVCLCVCVGGRVD